MMSLKTKQPAVSVLICFLLVAILSARDIQAGEVYVALVIDPPTTAFSGVPASGGFNGTSQRSGPGTWHLFALDDVDNTFGINQVAIKVVPGPGGTIQNISNRLPMTAWDDDPSFGSGNGPFNTGFNNGRSGNNMSLIAGSQATLGDATQPLIGGIGQEASNFQIKTGGQSFGGTLNGQWGNYADFPPVNFGGGIRYPLFVGEGTYTGSPPTIDTRNLARGGSGVCVWNNAGLNDWDIRDVVLLVPEPAAMPIIGIAVGALVCQMRRRR